MKNVGVYNKYRVRDREPKVNGPERLRVLEKVIKENNLRSGAELGVRSGELYYYLLAHCPDLHLLGVDVLDTITVGDGKRKKVIENNKKDQGFSWDMESYYNFIMELIEEYKPRASFIRDYTTEAVKLIEDESLDFVFIDADHAYSSVLRDIEDWTPKVKKGGYITGHDWYLSGVRKAVQEKFGNVIAGRIEIKPDSVWMVRKV